MRLRLHYTGLNHIYVYDSLFQNVPKYFFYFIRKIWSWSQGWIRFIFYFIGVFIFKILKKDDICCKEQCGTTDPRIVTIQRIFIAFLSCRPDSSSTNLLFPAEFHSSGGFLVQELVIPGGKPLLRWLPRPWACNSRRNNHSSGGFSVVEPVIPGGITLYAVFLQTATFAVPIQR
jgi:hypothetical protein